VVWHSQGVVYKGLTIPMGNNTIQSKLTPKRNTFYEYFDLQSSVNYACRTFLFSPCSLSRKNVAVEVVQATDKIFQKPRVYKTFLKDKQYLESLPVIKFASLSSFLAEKRKNFLSNSWNKKHSCLWCKPSSTFVALNKVEEVRLYSWYLLIKSVLLRRKVSQTKRYLPFSSAFLRPQWVRNWFSAGSCIRNSNCLVSV